jgi:hypothetical protein
VWWNVEVVVYGLVPPALYLLLSLKENLMPSVQVAKNSGLSRIFIIVWINTFWKGGVNITIT